MLGLLVAIPLLGAAPDAGKAVSLAKQKQWDELYLAFAAASPEGVSKGDRAKIARALAQGCAALEGEDPNLAFSLGDKSVAFEATADGLYCAALTAKRTDQRGAAEEALQKGAGTFKADGRFFLELGRLYVEDGQPGEAAAALGKVPKKSKQWAEANQLLGKVGKESGESVAGPKLVIGGPSPQPTGQRPIDPPAPGSLTYESGVDEEGRRIRQNQYFRFRYFNAKRDFGQRADYEGDVQGALERARVEVQRLLGVARDKPLDVILYSKEEFRLHHGPQAAQSVAGFYSADAIRMNDSAQINDQTRATLVHEYVHAVMDEVLAFNGRALPTWLHEGTAEYVEWRSMGQDGPPYEAARYIQSLAIQGNLPKLAQMDQGPLIATRNPGLSYAVAALGVRLLIERKSMYELVELMRECGQGTPFPQALERRFGTTVEKLDEELMHSLQSR